VDYKIQLNNVFKIFGDQPKGRALQLAKAGVGKDDIQAATEHVVGLHDVSFGVKKGETFVVMGLSGSGKSTAIRMVNKLHTVTDGEVLVERRDDDGELGFGDVVPRHEQVDLGIDDRAHDPPGDAADRWRSRSRRPSGEPIS